MFMGQIIGPSVGMGKTYFREVFEICMLYAI